MARRLLAPLVALALVHAAAGELVYDEGLAAGWEDRSWKSESQTISDAGAFSGSSYLSVTLQGDVMPTVAQVVQG